MRIEPTVGRTVHLILANPNGIAVRIGQPLCAQIAAVLDTGRINIGFLDYNGVHSNMVDIEMAQEGEAVPPAPYCKWMDYQVAVARREASDAPGEAFPIGGGLAVPLGGGLPEGLTLAQQGSIIETLTATGEQPAISEADSKADLDGTPRVDNPTTETPSSAPEGTTAAPAEQTEGKPVTETPEQPLA